MTKQQQIDELRKQLENAYSMIDDCNKRMVEMVKKKDDDFTDSPLYRDMKRELILANKLKDYENRFRSQNTTAMQLYRENRILSEDNKRLCAEHDISYWEGLTDHDYFDSRAYDKLLKEKTDLEASLAAKDTIISYLKAILAGEEPTPPEMKPSGKPKKIDDATVRRIRKLYREGWTMQQISVAEGVSKGFISQSCKGVKRNKKEKSE